jgi:glycosyltransferase involved in cell wall biosynthesis
MTLLTIGLPVYNNESSLESSVRSLLEQSFGDFELVISDDSSSDGTQDIARSLAKSDPRIRYIRQLKNLRYQNFGQLLRQAETPYFMWAAGDDRWKSGFVSACLGELLGHPELVCVVSKVQFEFHGRPTRVALGTYSLLKDPVSNIAQFLSAPQDNSRMYGVFRTEAAQASFPQQSFHAYDWAFSAATLRFGGHLELDDVLMLRDETPPERYTDMVRVDSSRRLERLFPLLAMTRWLLSLPGFPRRSPAIQALLAINIDKHIEYVTRFHPSYARSIGSAIGWWKRNRRRLVVS